MVSTESTKGSYIGICLSTSPTPTRFKDMTWLPMKSLWFVVRKSKPITWKTNTNDN